MTRLRFMLALALCALALPGALRAQQQPAWEMEALTDQGWAEFDFQTGLGLGTNGVLVRYGSAFLTADQVGLNHESGEVTADGHVRVQSEEQIWVGEHIRYNFKTHQMQAEQFRTGKAPVFATGQGLHGEVTNRVYIANNGIITTDDVAEPANKVRAKYLKIIPGERIVARHATLYVEGVPVFYFPYYTRKLGQRSNHFNFVAGDRTIFGPFLLSSYTFFLNEQLDGVAHVDYRERRGPGAGPDLNYHLGPWGEGTFRYYYLHDHDPGAGGGDPTISENRQRVYFSYQSAPATNLSFKTVVRYQGDTNIIREFYEGEYRQNPQPSTYMEANKFWQNFSLDTYVQPRVNEFLETVERLPDVRLTGYRQELGASPIYYESESSVGYYSRLFPSTNSSLATPDFSGARADTFHQLLLPETFFGWLNVTPRVGGRLTYYGKTTGPGATTDELYRGVFNTGAEVSFKASQLWPGVQSDFFQADGLRHIFEPSVNYVYVPRPNYAGTNDLPQFDYELPSLRLLPIDFPDYNSIDSIDSQNVVRLGLHNKLQTKREGQTVNLVDWNIYTDWRLQPNSQQTTFADLYSDLTLRPRSWLTFDSMTRYDIEDNFLRMSVTTVTLRPQKSWSWTFGQVYLRDDLSGSPTALGPGENLLTSSFLFRLSENWGLRAYHYFDVSTGYLREQDYAIFRDMRSWTAALTFQVRSGPGTPQDLTVAFSFWLKAYPKAGRGTETGPPTY
ncbi:MAG: LPS assembly protein LptD [Verrucomicrobiota bacterium]|jgi:lipopolysaccharide assembly outer membrane protein LptD (OstA)